jgi:glycosyltransferase involved in cell wall biosynthesis
MRILQLSTADQLGGAEKVAYDLHKAYEQRGHEAFLAVGRKTLPGTNVFELNHAARRPAWAHFWRRQQLALCERRIRFAPVLAGHLADVAEPRAWWERWRGLENFDFPASHQLLDLAPQRPQLLHAHNLHGDYFDLRALPELSRQLPIIVTLHDEWLFTGHCAHSFGSERWRHGCEHCPDLEIHPPLHRDTTAQNWRRKRALYQRCRFYVAAPSRWLLDEARESILQPAIIEARHIPNGVPLAQFQPFDKTAARRELRLPLDANIALFVGSSTRRNPFKDYATLEAAMRQLATRLLQREVLLICLGEAAQAERLGAVTLRFLDFERDPARVARFYQAADVYVHAARADTFPNTVLEALACGTPVVATAVGGIPEQIVEGETGFLVPVGDSAAMAQRLELLFNDEALRTRLGCAAAVHARAHFNLDRQVDAYLAWYQEILAEGV